MIVKRIEHTDGFLKQKLLQGYNTLNGSELTFTYCEYDSFNNNTPSPLGNLFKSLNFPTTSAERQQFNTLYANTAFRNFANVNKMVIVEVPQSQYGELIDGKTIELKLPIVSGNTVVNLTAYSTYFKSSTLTDAQQNNLLSDGNDFSSQFGAFPSVDTDGNSNVSYLFSNQIRQNVLSDSLLDTIASNVFSAMKITTINTTSSTISFNIGNPPNFAFLKVNNTYTVESYKILKNPNSVLFSDHLESDGLLYRKLSNDSHFSTIDIFYNFIDGTSENVINASSVTYTQDSQFKYITPLKDITGITITNFDKLDIKFISVLGYYPLKYFIIPVFREREVSKNDWTRWSSSNRFNGTIGNTYANFSGSTIDEPIGIAYLDKGLIVITEPSIVNNLNYTAATSSGFNNIPAGSPYTGDTNYIKVYFNAGAELSYRSYTTEIIQDVTCIAMPNEFYESDNSTFDLGYPDGNPDNLPTFFTKVPLYNSQGELIAIGVTNKPVKKEKNKPLTINVTISV